MVVVLVVHALDVMAVRCASATTIGVIHRRVVVGCVRQSREMAEFVQGNRLNVNADIESAVHADRVMHFPFSSPLPLTTHHPASTVERMSHKSNRRNRENRSGPPTLADIVREKTNDGKVIVDFYLDVVRGKLDDEGFEVCHRLEAAEQVHAIAPGLVAEYIAQLTGVECNHVIRRRRTRDIDCRPRADQDPLPTRNSARARHEALEYLASALAAPSLADDPRVAGIVHESTDHGKTVVSFLLHVMHGVVRGFRPRQRVQAASELLGHIVRDELRADGVLSSSQIGSSFPPGESSSPSSREPIPAPAPQRPTTHPQPSYRRKACPVLDTGPVPRPSLAMGATLRTPAPPPNSPLRTQN